MGLLGDKLNPIVNPRSLEPRVKKLERQHQRTRHYVNNDLGLQSAATFSSIEPVQTYGWETIGISYIINRDGDVLEAKDYDSFPVEFDAHIIGVKLLAEPSGSVVVDIKKSTFGDYDSAFVSITASAKPTLTLANKYADYTIEGWTTSIHSGDLLKIILDSTNIIEKLTVTLLVSKRVTAGVSTETGNVIDFYDDTPSPLSTLGAPGISNLASRGDHSHPATSPTLHATTHESGGDDEVHLGLLTGNLTDAQHGSLLGGSSHTLVDIVDAGFMSALDKIKLDSLPDGSTVGTITSIGLTGSSMLSITNSPITTSGNINLDFSVVPRHTFLGGPLSGSNAIPTFRLLDYTDMPIFDPGVGFSDITGDWRDARVVKIDHLDVNHYVGPYPTYSTYPDNKMVMIWDSSLGSFGAWNQRLLVQSDMPTFTGGSGDITGPYSGPTVTKIWNKSVLSATNNNGDIMYWNNANSRWEYVLFFYANSTANKFWASPSGSTGLPTYRTLVAADLPSIAGDVTGAYSGVTVGKLLGRTIDTTTPSDGQVYQWSSGSSKWVAITPTVYGSVTSVDMTVPSILSISGNPITTSGTLAITLATESSNLVFAGPTTGSAATPTFRSLVVADLPNTVVYTSDSRLTDSRTPNGSASGDLSGSYPGPTVSKIQGNSILSGTPTDGYVLTWVNANSRWEPVAEAHIGTVTSVALSLPAFITVSGSPVTSSGTLTGTLANQSANLVFSGPSTGSATTPTFRALVAADLPNTVVYTSDSRLSDSRSPNGSASGDLSGSYPGPTVSKIQGNTVLSGTPSNNQVLTWISANSRWEATAEGHVGTVTSVDMTVPSILSISGNPITSSGTLAVTLANESANLIFSGPTTGSATTPTFRSLVKADQVAATAYTDASNIFTATQSITVNSLGLNVLPSTSAGSAVIRITSQGVVGGSGGNSDLQFYDNTTQGFRFLAAFSNGAGSRYGGFLAYTDRDGNTVPLRFFTTDTTPAQTQALYIESGTNQGFIGIGTLTNPTAYLHIKAPNDNILLKLQANASQTTNLFNAYASDGTTIYDSLSSIGAMLIRPKDSATTTVTDILTLGHDTSGTVGANYGSRTLWTLRSNNTANREAFDITPTWVVATDGSRTARVVLNVWDTAVREAMRIEASGSAAKIGFLGATAVTRSSAYIQTYSTATRTLPTYTTNAQTSAYTGIATGVAGTPYAQLTDLNALRTAYENLRAAHDATEQVLNSIIDDLQALGLVG